MSAAEEVEAALKQHRLTPDTTPRWRCACREWGTSSANYQDVHDRHAEHLGEALAPIREREVHEAREQGALGQSRVDAKAQRELIDQIDALETEVAYEKQRAAEAVESLHDYEAAQVNWEVDAQAIRREALGPIRDLVENARRHAGGSYTAQVDALSLERAMGDLAATHDEGGE